jgi:DNA-binding transcriptional LysR family regulator
VWEADNDSRLEVHRMRSAEFVVIAHPDHPLTRERVVTAAMLASQKLLLPVAESGTRAFVERQLAAAGVEITASMEFDDVEALKQAAKGNLGLGFVAKKTVEEDVAHGSLKEITIDGQRFERSIYVVTRKGKVPSMGGGRFVEAAKKFLIQVE